MLFGSHDDAILAEEPHGDPLQTLSMYPIAIGLVKQDLVCLGLTASRQYAQGRHI
jgi:hypothetical protein